MNKLNGQHAVENAISSGMGCFMKGNLGRAGHDPRGADMDDNFNIALLSIGSGKLVFLRINKDSKIFENVKASLILLENGKEQKIADNILLYDAKNKVNIKKRFDNIYSI